ncbi:carbonic anhydrase family protein [Microbacterium sp. X-17]|uniref:carbonic anhydrase n=1 Tax=Microbacterium sp. X-17 TaxID=3144404 RepID=UPI0031F49FE3
MTPAPPRRTAAFVAAALVALGTAGCSAPAGTSAPSPSLTSWSYSGADGPAHWSGVAPACADWAGARQSPVDIVTGELKRDDSAAPVRVDYGSTPFAVEDNGHAIEAVPQDAEAGSIELGGRIYRLQQFHFHAASEHTVDGVQADAELHLVHRAAGGEVAVLGVLLTEGEGNPALGALVDSSDAAHTAPAVIDPAALLPASGASARYTGSLTTPPCTEGVSWNVFLTPTTLSRAQLDALTGAHPANHRPVQPLHGRTVTAVRAG